MYNRICDPMYGIKSGTIVLNTYSRVLLQNASHDSNSNTSKIPLENPEIKTIIINHEIVNTLRLLFVKEQSKK